MTPKTSSDTRPNFSAVETGDVARDAIWRVIHEVWQLLDDAETNSSGITTPDQARWRAVSSAMDELEALVPDSAGPFWGGFPVNYFWPKFKKVGAAETLNGHETCAAFTRKDVPPGTPLYIALTQAEAENGACTDCGGTGTTFQTERQCTCRPSASVEPSEHMIDAGAQAYSEARTYSADDRESARAIWSAMMARRPVAPTAEPDDALDRAWKAEGRCVEFRRLIDRLCRAADEYGVRYLDSDDMTPEAEELSEATRAARAFLQKDNQS